MVKRLKFINTDITKTKSYDMMRAWFESNDETFYWVPGWAELYFILDKAIDVEESNWYKSEWKKILKDIKRVLEKRQTKPFIPRRKRKLLKVADDDTIKIKNKKLLNRIRKAGDTIKCPNCYIDIHIEETECPHCGHPI